MDYQKIILAGNATQDAKRQKSQKGDVTYATFSLGVGAGKGKSTYFPVVVFGKLAEVAVKYVKQGRQLLVDGRIEVGEKGYFNVIASQIRLGAQASKAEPDEKSV